MSSLEFIWILHPKLTLKRFGSFWIYNWCTKFWHASKKHAHFKVETKAVPHGSGCSGDNHQVQVLHLIPLRWFSLLPHKELVIGCHWCWMCWCQWAKLRRFYLGRWWHPVSTGFHRSSISCKAWLSLLQFTWLSFGIWDELGWRWMKHEATKTKAFVCDLLRPRPNMPESSSR